MTPQDRLKIIKACIDLDWSYGRIGEKLGITRARVHQLVAKNGIFRADSLSEKARKIQDRKDEKKIDQMIGT